MIHQLRRFLPRQFADWRGTCFIESDLEGRWRDCRVIDISSAGAGVELLDPPEGPLEGRRIFLAVHLQGEVRHAGPGRHGGTRVGAQFVELSEGEKAYLASLTNVDARW